MKIILATLCILTFTLPTKANVVVLKNQKVFDKLKSLVTIISKKEDNQLKVEFEVQCKAPFQFVETIELIYGSYREQEYTSISVPIATSRTMQKDFHVLKGSFHISPNLIKAWDVKLKLFQDYEKMSKANNGIIIAGAWSFVLSEYIDSKLLPKFKKSKIPEEELDLVE